MKRKCKFLSLVLGIIIMATSLSQPVQAASSKTEVKKSVTALFNSIKKFDQRGMDQYVKSWEYKPTIYSNVFGKTYFKNSSKKITYKINSISVKGKKATVKVKVKYVNSQEIYTDALLTTLAATYKNPYISNEVLTKQIRKVIIASSKKHKVKYRTQTITLKMEKSSKKWILKKGDKTLLNIVLSNWIYATAHNGFN